MIGGAAIMVPEWAYFPRITSRWLKYKAYSPLNLPHFWKNFRYDSTLDYWIRYFGTVCQPITSIVHSPITIPTCNTKINDITRWNRSVSIAPESRKNTNYRPITKEASRLLKLRRDRQDIPSHLLSTAARTRDFEYMPFMDDSPMSDDDSGELLAIEGFEMCDMYDGAVFRQQVPFFRMLSSELKEIRFTKLVQRRSLSLFYWECCSFGACWFTESSS